MSTPATTTTTASPRASRPRPVNVPVTDTALGAAIRDRRARLSMHQETLAARAGLDYRVLSRLERGERPCRFTEFVAIAEALNISAMALLKLAFERGAETAA